MSSLSKPSRRNFMKLAATASGGLFLGFSWTSSVASALEVVSDTAIAAGEIEFNSFLALSPDGIVTIFSPNPELGQNIKTSFPMIVAEELDADWTKVKVVQAPLDTNKFERQVTGGSGAVPHSWDRLRTAGATARHMLMEAAAKRWKVSASTLTTDNGMVVHQATGRKLSYGDLATEASKVPVPKDVKLKDPKNFKLIGTAVRNVDNHEMITGKPLYGMDVYKEGMLFAMIQRPKAFGMKLKSVDAAAAKAMPGIVDVVTFKSNVAVVGKSTWQVNKARKALKLEYEEDAPLESSTDHDRIFKELLDSPDATVHRKDGDVAAAFQKAAKVIKSEYQCPFLPHSPMEPMNFFAHVRLDGVELAGPTQTPERARSEVAKLLNIAPEKVTVELTRLGGGFGRRLSADYVVEAAELSSIIKAPVKVIWTREDDMTGGTYRPAVRYRFEAALDAKGNMIGYKLRGVGMSSGNPTREDNFPSGSVDNLLIDSVEHKSPITTGPWRAPITNFLAFAEQSFLDEVAQAAGKDPVQFRLELLAKAKKAPVGEIKYDIDRMKGVIDLAVEKSGWGRKKGVAQGFSVYFSHRSYVAQVGEVAVKNNVPVVTKVYAACDCGMVVNLSGAYQQVKGGIVDGLGHAMYSNLTFKNGAPDQKNFNNYRLIRLKEVPEVDVYFVNNGINPTGLGEPALPPTGGAVANAIYKATGKRLRNQPFIEQAELKTV
ncbi:xanthine dehydrogenase family protein molybdopterin-binding subunit [Pontibacter diazotrophicus]|uniref:Xanthine dehydrogenase family protein molybdopterin-binding subunit n=1 Tax=Pontibacter diazotrophicus TaxID=1400979 RepID=A0A3D8LC34_9BACT|nr:xanthine dehydrogenase family protein molybdopterin-binding subunit [Pontibacter diazotrophicus]RDV14955.1 xanthine dehydrogenase family protein molybdopterin-binding subunit [Pontibacter diazotrophicus]